MGCIFSKQNSVEPVDEDCQSEEDEDCQSEDDQNIESVPSEEDKISEMFSVVRPTTQLEHSQEVDSDTTFITEYSDKALVDEVEQNFKEKECLSLPIIGVPCQSRMTQKQKAEYEEAKIIAMLTEEGLISQPKIRTAGGLSFEIVQAHPRREKPPPFLERLETRKSDRIVTIDEQLERIKKAEQRRKEREDGIVQRSQMESQKRIAVLEKVNERKRENEDILEEKMENVEKKRERRLEEIRERMKERERRAERVRLRKGLNLDDVGGVDGEQEN